MVSISEYLNLEKEIEKEGIFNVILDLDANYFINIKRLKDTNEEIFKNSYKNIKKYFRKIYDILSNTSDRKGRLYKKAIELFTFKEINNLGLGYSKGKNGNAIGKKLAQKIIEDAKEIIDAGNNNPDLFLLVGLFEEKIGPDRLSDIYSNLIYNEILEYTLEKNKLLGINKENYPNYKFEDGFLINPYKNTKILLLPKDILHELPIAREWEDIDYMCSRIQIIREEVNNIIGNEWKKLSIKDKKLFIKEKIIKNKDKFNLLIENYENYKVDPYDFSNDKVGFYKICKYIKNLKLIASKNIDKHDIKSIVLKICEEFKDLVENNNLIKLLYDDNNKFRGEKIVQILFYGLAQEYCKVNNLDISPELNSGRGNIDFKISKGYNERVIIEVKLTSNNQLIHGFEIQLNEYAKAEKTNKLIYLVIDDKKDIKTLKKLYDRYNKTDKSINLIVVSTEKKESASKYNPDKNK